MSDAIVNEVARMLNKSPYIIPIYLSVIVGMILGSIIAVNDYYTSYAGIQMLPIRQIRENPSSIEPILREGYYIAVSLLPQVVGAISFYVALATWGNELMSKTAYLAVAFCVLALVIDTITGFLYHYPYGIENIDFMSVEFYSALFMSFGVDTVCSEFMVSITFGLYAQMRSHALNEMINMGGMWEKWATLGRKSTKTPSRPKKQPKKKPSRPRNGTENRNPPRNRPSGNQERPQSANPFEPPDNYNVFGDRLTP